MKKRLTLALVIMAVLSLAPFTARALTITGITPDSGPAAGGTIVTITGDFTFGNVDAGGNSSCVISLEGKAYCWGQNQNGQLGDGTYIDRPVPVAVDDSGVLAGKTLVKIASSYDHTCALDSDGKAYCWGDGWYGQLGDDAAGLGSGSTVPVAVNTSGALAGKFLVDINNDYAHTCALDSEGALYCWGRNIEGQLGNGTNFDSAVPVALSTSGPLAGMKIIEIVAGYLHSCALTSGSQVYCWGWNGNGQFGNGTYTDSNVPVPIDMSGVLDGKTLVKMTSAYRHVCVLDSDGLAYCWGANYDGELGDGTYVTNPFPVAVDTSGVLNGKKLIEISLADYHTCALDDQGKAYCWGDNGTGDLGDGTTVPNSPLPVEVNTSGALNNKILTQLSSGWQHTCAVDVEGYIYCWGYGYYGSLGDNNFTNSNLPVRPHTISDSTGSELPDPVVLPLAVIFDQSGSPAACTGVVVAPNKKSLTCTTTAHFAGLVDVAVDNSVNTYTLARGFRYIDIDAPVIPGVPNTGTT